MLNIFGKSISKVFPETEVLSLRNVTGEGISLTHDEYTFMADELQYFPQQLSTYLLESESYEHSLLEETLLGDFIVHLLNVHSLSGGLRLCNKVFLYN